ncbi:MAG: YdcF family protein [Clostridia bacterium]|nr:YdcF family protein [Clostridia bacterium]
MRNGRRWMKNKLWLFSAVLLFVAGVLFFLAITGHGYLGCTLILTAALVVFYHFAGKKLSRIITILTVAALLAFAAVETPIIAAAHTDKDAECGYIIVLGAGVRGTTPSLSLTNRLNAALGFLEEHPDAVAIVSGGRGPGENITEAEAMTVWLEARGIVPERIIGEPEATSTSENLENSFRIIRERGDDPDGNVAIVTSEYHLYRAKLMAEDLGVEAYGVAGHTSMPTLMLNYFIREAFAVVYYWLFGA